MTPDNIDHLILGVCATTAAIAYFYLLYKVRK